MVGGAAAAAGGAKYADGGVYEERRAFVVGRLGVPAPWLDEALALRAGYADAPLAHAGSLYEV